MHGGRPRGFTLIELMIVVSIIPIVAAALTLLIGSLNNVRLWNESRLDAQESARRALDLWREDVACSTRIETGPDGTEMTIVRPNRDGGETMARYRLSDRGHLERADESARPPVRDLGEGCSDLQFRKVGRAWQAQWTASASDGVSKRSWPQSGFATPLAAMEE